MGGVGEEAETIQSLLHLPLVLVVALGEGSSLVAGVVEIAE